MRALVKAGLISSGVFSGSAFAAFPTCPSATPPSAQELTEWRAGAVAGLSGNEDVVAAAIDKCFPQVPKCLERTAAYALRAETASVNDDTPFESTPQRQPPKEILAPNANGFEYFIPEKIEEIAKAQGWVVARYKSRHAGGFDSSTPSLLMVYVPGDKVNPPVSYDRWLNFALPADDAANALNPTPQKRVPSVADYAAENGNGPVLPRTFTMVSLDKPAGGKPAQVYFQKFNRSGFGSGIYTPSSLSAASSCYSCHPNGLRAISPLGFHVREGEKQLPKEAWEAVQRMNDAMDEGADNKHVSWREASVNGKAKPFLRQKSHFPVIGASQPVNGYTRTKEFIMGGKLPNGQTVEGCFKDRETVSVVDIFGRPPGKNNVYKLTSTTNPNIDWEKVASAMNCESCHNNRGRGAINARTNYDQVEFKILVDQSMPFGSHQNPLDQGDVNAPVKDEFTPDERIAIANCLDRERDIESPLLSQWLTQKACN